MIVEIIKKYLESNKRLVVPNLGAFIVKQAGESVLFSNLIKNDDGVLRGLLTQQGVSELEAAGVIDRFVFEVNFRLDKYQACLLDGFGVLRKGSNGSISFLFNPKVEGEVLDGDASERLAERQAKVAPKPQPQVEEPMEFEVIAKPAAQEPKPQPKPQPSSERVYGDDNLTASTQKRPAAYVKGLRYGSGKRPVTGRDYGAPQKRGTGDVFIKIAIAVAILAILAMGYGVYCEWQNSRYDEPEISNSEIYNEEPASAEGEVRNPDLEYITPKEKK